MKRATYIHNKYTRQNKHFNPRPREEGDLRYCTERARAEISIHVLVKRATFAIFYSKDIPDISIHALVKRATLPFVWL